jgi:hypothetical protein
MEETEAEIPRDGGGEGGLRRGEEEEKEEEMKKKNTKKKEWSVSFKSRQEESMDDGWGKNELVAAPPLPGEIGCIEQWCWLRGGRIGESGGEVVGCGRGFAKKPSSKLWLCGTEA